MDKLTAETLRGNWATLLLPIQANEEIDYTLLAEEIDRLIAFGVDGIYSNGTAGEFHNQPEEEFDAVNWLLSEKCLKAGMRFQVGASHPSPIISLNRMRRAIEIHPDALQVVLPDWVAASGPEQIDFLRRIAVDAKGIPLVLYNPPHAKSVLSPQDYTKFKMEVPELIGIKVLSHDAAWVTGMKEYAAHLSVFVPGHFQASGVQSGVASGAYSNVARINPGAAQRWWDQMADDLPGALEIEGRILQFFQECIAPFQQAGYSNPALDKFLAVTGGWVELRTRLRWPYRCIPEANVLVVCKRAKELIP